MNYWMIFGGMLVTHIKLEITWVKYGTRKYGWVFGIMGVLMMLSGLKLI